MTQEKSAAAAYNTNWRKSFISEARITESALRNATRHSKSCATPASRALLGLDRMFVKVVHCACRGEKSEFQTF